MSGKTSLTELEDSQEFLQRHIGPTLDEQASMLAEITCTDMQELMQQVVPDSIRLNEALPLAESITEQQALNELRGIANKNKVNKSYIGQGYYNCLSPNVIHRNVLENPAWYTAYTPYQAEISQGRLEALFTFQTVVSELTGLAIANASMLDEATAAAEAMTLCLRMSKSKASHFFVDQGCLPQTIEIIRTRAEPIGIDIIVGDPFTDLVDAEVFGILLQYPGVSGAVNDYRDLIAQAHESKALVVMAADILSLVLLESPGALGADIAVGSTQRFGVPLGFGGPHAAYFAARENYKRSLPGRLVGLSQDNDGKPAYRLALQTREQHIRREKATSNICTAQVLLAVIAGMYAVYHGAAGLKRIAARVHLLTSILAEGLKQSGLTISNSVWFDTLTINTADKTADIHARAEQLGFNFRQIDDAHLGISLDETTSREDVTKLWDILLGDHNLDVLTISKSIIEVLPKELLRTEEILTQAVFKDYQSETEMLRYLRKLADMDIALDRSMIPLGSCTMKLNATAEMLPISWPEFSSIHPFVPSQQAHGYRRLIDELENMLCKISGYAAFSLQPNAGSQGEYAGLLAIRAYHRSRGDEQRDICLIPTSAHGTNPASAHMCGMKVVTVKCDAEGNVDIKDLRLQAETHSEKLSAIMVTYPSTHGVFEEEIRTVCEIVHEHGGQVYMDGANMNAMVGLCQPGKFGGDVSHLNLHKTFCIPHGGGGPGIGPIGVATHLAPFLPKESNVNVNDRQGALISAAPWGSASILPISWMYICMMGAQGLLQASEVAILNANYIATRLEEYYPILYKGVNNRVAHECIIDIRPFAESSGVSVEDVAKRLIDYGFHAPTMSFPVAGTLMIEPTESESKAELDRFCNAMITIKSEIDAIASGGTSRSDNPLVNAPHTAQALSSETWDKSYSRQSAVFPDDESAGNKYWPPVGRVDNVYGDKNLVCTFK
jgi:glycine dehydrogenase